MLNKSDWTAGRYFEAPDRILGPLDGPSIFLAGGITNCEDWQSYARVLLDPRWHVFNPRRADFDVTDPTASETQIKWEFAALERASVILFWFAGGPSPQPITLYEFGRHVALSKSNLVVGSDPRYSRVEDVKVQFRLARPFTRHYVCSTLEETVGEANSLLPNYDPRTFNVLFS